VSSKSSSAGQSSENEGSNYSDENQAVQIGAKRLRSELPDDELDVEGLVEAKAECNLKR